MSQKLCKSKFYIVDLDTRVVDVRQHFDRCFDALAWAKRDGLHERYTALIGRHILAHTDTWSIPLTIEEAFDKYLDEIVSGEF